MMRPYLRFVALLLLSIISYASASLSAYSQNNPLVGVWRIQMGDAVSELVIQPSGQFSKMDSRGAARNLITGFISVGSDPPILRLNIRDYEPKVWCGPRGCSPIQMIAAETYGFQFQGGRLILSDAAGQYAFTRIQ